MLVLACLIRRGWPVMGIGQDAEVNSLDMPLVTENSTFIRCQTSSPLVRPSTTRLLLYGITLHAAWDRIGSNRARVPDGAAPRVWGISAIKSGTRVRLRIEACNESRPHLLLHARRRDVGVVSDTSKRSPAMAKLYTVVHFEQCGQDHRLLDSELQRA